MTRQEYEEIVLKYGGKMTDAAISRKFNTSVVMIRRTRIRLKIPTYKMTDVEKSKINARKANLCFDCKNADSSKKCIWVRTLSKFPTVIDDDGIEQSCAFGEAGQIIDCPEFVRDEIRH